jgi:malate permease and related proteins
MMAAVSLVLLCLLIGVALRRSGRLPDDAPAALNGYVINVALPALALVHLHRAPLTIDFMTAAGGAWLLLGFAAAFFALVARRFGLAKGEVGTLVLTAGLANTSFVGLPMIEAYVGRDGMPLGIVIDQLGSYLALSTLGLLVAARYSGEKVGPRMMLRRLATFPPLIALVVALLLRPVAVPDAAYALLARIGDTVAPVALLAVGLQLRLGAIRERLRALSIGLMYKLVFGPALVAAICLMLWEPSTPAAELARIVMIFESAMGPMIGAAVVANQFRLDGSLAALMVGLGIPLSLLTAPAWLFVVS